MTKQEAMRALAKSERELGCYGIGELINCSPLSRSDWLRMVVAENEIVAAAEKQHKELVEWNDLFCAGEFVIKSVAEIADDIRAANAKYLKLAAQTPEIVEEDWDFVI